MSPEASPSPARSRELTTWLVGTAVAVAVLLGAVVVMGGRVDEAATWGLVVAAGAMVFALRALYAMAMALARPPVETTLEQEDVAGSAGVRELREDRRRVLRAINELRFDYEMGKLSDEDYRKVREGYELRAVEVMRALEAEKSLHPALRIELERRGVAVPELEEDDTSEGGEAPAEVVADAPAAKAYEKLEDDAAEGSTAEDDAAADGAESSDEGGEGHVAEGHVAEARGSDEADGAEAGEGEAEDAEGSGARAGEGEGSGAGATEGEAEQAAEDTGEAEGPAAATTCSSCEGVNDADAKFCKHCGAKLGAASEEAAG